MKTYDTTPLMNGLKQWNIALTDAQADAFIRYYERLTEWNQRMNLTAVTEWNEVCSKHFLDSLSLLSVTDPDSYSSVADIGTGAGFPGIPLKIMHPEWRMLLADSLMKRIRFLQTVIDELKLSSCQAVHARAEDLGRQKSHREQYDLCVSRAVANLSTLCEYCLPLVKEGGLFVSYKSAQAEEEIALAESAICLLGGSIENVHTFTLPDSDYGRSLVLIRKQKKTPSRYPRKAGMPAKEPLS